MLFLEEGDVIYCTAMLMPFAWRAYPSVGHAGSTFIFTFQVTPVAISSNMILGLCFSYHVNMCCLLIKSDLYQTPDYIDLLHGFVVS